MDFKENLSGVVGLLHADRRNSTLTGVKHSLFSQLFGESPQNKALPVVN